ncbi:MAG TPA: phytoene desaturase family protein, partial [Anaerolineales bacterium]
PATFSMMSFTELAHGVWYPRGGMYSVVEALVSLAEQAGVEFVYDTTVERIETDGDHACGLLLEHGERPAADIILANADLPYVYDELLPPDAESDRLQKKKFSCSVISFFWGMDRAYPELGPHTLFLAEDYRENFQSIARDHELPANPSLYVHAPARMDSSMAPEGQDTLIAIIPVGHMKEKEDQDWAAIRDAARGHVFRRLALLGITGLEEHIKFEMSYSPPSWHKRYNLVKGSTHGLSHNLTQLAWFRPHNRHARYRNLYFVGASTHPGTGMPTAMISARLVAQRIMDEMNE